MNDRPFLYFAHSLLIYGNDYEKYCLSLIEKTFPNTEVFNPNGRVQQTTDAEAMKHCLAAIADTRCKALVFATTSGIVGKGVMREIMLAQERGLAVYVIIGNKIFYTESVHFTPVNFSERVYAVANVVVHAEV